MHLQDIIVELVQPRPTVEIHLPDKRVLSGPRGVCVGSFLRNLPEYSNPQMVGAVVNGELRELTFAIEMDAKVRPVTMADEDGARIYRRSLTFLLEAAFEDLFPEMDLSVDYSVVSGGYYCMVEKHAPLTKEQLALLEDHMSELVIADLTFEREQVPLQEAIDYFIKTNKPEKANLLKYRQKDFLILYRLRERRDYHHGYMVPSTGFLRYFSVNHMGDGFVLRFPRRQTPEELVPIRESPKLLQTFRQYGDWLARLGIENVGALNDAIQSNRTREIILVSEALHEQKISDIARQIVDRKGKARIVLIAGPSSSGKTTFSKRLSVQLLAQGLSPFPLEMDNYFFNRERTPRDAKGDFDFETIEALDVSLLGDHLKRLLAGEQVQLPHYNFKTGTSGPGEVVQMESSHLIILEGIHGLNPKLLPEFPQDEMFRIYCSALTQLNLDRHNRISTTDTRLIRRIVRDARERGYSAQQTIRRWESVQRGEKRHIFPYQDNANEMFNSALVYELSALRLLVEPLLRQVPFGTDEYIEAKRLLALMEWFQPLDVELIPDNSIVREFLGGSILRDFKLWENRIGE